MNPPVAEGDECTVSIDAETPRGEGVARIEGFVVFVKNAKKGEKVKIRITIVKRTFALAEIVR